VDAQIEMLIVVDAHTVNESIVEN